MTCSICQSAASPYFQAPILGKYNVQYFRCSNCQFIFTESPYWLDEAYNSAITRLDIGLVGRNELMTPVVKMIINKWFNPNSRFIDYGGGYGMLVRMLRDRGYDFYRQDIHCENLYAESFDTADVPPFRAELLTAFEVFEHLIDPVKELEKMLALSDNILFSTVVQPSADVSPDSWWYVAPEIGQHVSLYSRASLYKLAERLGLNYVWNEQSVHLFTRKSINNQLFKSITHPRLLRWYDIMKANRKSLLLADYKYVYSQLQKTQLNTK